MHNGQALTGFAQLLSVAMQPDIMDLAAARAAPSHNMAARATYDEDLVQSSPERRHWTPAGMTSMTRVDANKASGVHRLIPDIKFQEFQL